MSSLLLLFLFIDRILKFADCLCVFRPLTTIKVMFSSRPTLLHQLVIESLAALSNLNEREPESEGIF